MLQAHNVGEADRFCILFTREKGRLAARARAVRKPKSHLGGSLLPFSHARMELIEHGSSYIIAGASIVEEYPHLSSVPSFSVAGEGIEVILRLIQDDEPLPALFDLTRAFLQHAAIPSKSLLLAFTLCTLHLLGFLPESFNVEFFRGLTSEERLFVESCARGEPLDSFFLERTGRLEQRCQELLLEQLSQPLKSSFVSL